MSRVKWSELSQEQRLELIRLTIHINDLSIGTLFNILGIGGGVLVYLFLNSIFGVIIIAFMSLATAFNSFAMIKASFAKARWVLAQGKGLIGDYRLDALASGIMGEQKK